MFRLEAPHNATAAALMNHTYRSGLSAAATIGGVRVGWRASVPLPDIGAAVGQARRGMGQFFATPGETRAKARELDVAAHALHRSVLGFTPQPDQTGAWAVWRAGWVDWLAASQALINEILQGGALGYGDILLQYENTLADWRADFMRRWRADVPGPAIVTHPQKKDDTSFWERFGLGVAVALAVGAAVYIAKGAVSR